MNEPGDIVLAARGITKSFPGVRALNDVSLTLRRGRLMALLGENGAGKSTLMNILAGVFPPDAGEITLGGRKVVFGNPRQAREHGVGIIFQELSLLSNLTIAENIFLGREPRNALGFVDYARMNRETADLLQRVSLSLPPTTPASELRVGQQQLVEIARALSMDVRVLIMDEPTSALSENEVNLLFTLIADLKKRGVAIVYITHKFEELGPLADDVTVLRDGCFVGAAAFHELTLPQIISMMVGRESGELYQKAPGSPRDEVLRVEGASLRHSQRHGDFLVQDVSFSVRRGEILGIFGLMGAGRTELLETIFGLHPSSGRARITIEGKPIAIANPADAIAAGLALAPEDRKRDGLVLEMSVQENASLACLAQTRRFGFLSSQREEAATKPFIERFRVKTPSPRQIIRNLSGGNQQKVILAKWLAIGPKVLLLDEPTRGIDIGAKKEIYTLIEEFAREGLGVVVVSSELPEVLAVSDRVVVMCEGRKTAEFARAEATPEKMLHAALPRN
ncbi:MAG: sugar ABC transporter ATP-binding protein [Nibricoccus sp.]